MDGFIVEVGDNDGLIFIDSLLDGDKGLQVPQNSCVINDTKLETIAYVQKKDDENIIYVE